MPRLRLRGRLLTSHLLVAVTGTATVFLAVGLVAPGAFDTAMGHAAGPGMGGMGEMMGGLVRAAFQDAVHSALVVAFAAASVAALVASLALSARISAPVTRLAAASRRLARGRYEERVAGASGDEIGELAESFNRMAESLEATERRRLELVGDVAHELRTPLATLDGYLEGLEDGVVEAGGPTWTLLRTETGRLARLVDDLQELWRAEAGQLALSLGPVDIASQLRAACDRFGISAREHGIDFRPEVPPGGLVARADPVRVAQILDDLLVNAIRHSPPGGSIELTAGRDRERVVVSVTDQGPGLVGEQLERVFERFYRVDAARSRAHGGSGIGLAIVRSLARAMGGDAWAESPGPGQGATFRLALPVERLDARGGSSTT
jgi:two-component system, OmpR family, sensor histidine kinase BaeS